MGRNILEFIAIMNHNLLMDHRFCRSHLERLGHFVFVPKLEKNELIILLKMDRLSKCFLDVKKSINMKYRKNPVTGDESISHLEILNKSLK